MFPSLLPLCLGASADLANGDASFEVFDAKRASNKVGERQTAQGHRRGTKELFSVSLRTSTFLAAPAGVFCYFSRGRCCNYCERLTASDSLALLIIGTKVREIDLNSFPACSGKQSLTLTAAPQSREDPQHAVPRCSARRGVEAWRRAAGRPKAPELSGRSWR